MSLRRQLLNRNMSRDFLLQGSTLQTLPEEEPCHKDVPVTDLDEVYDNIEDETTESPATVEVTGDYPQNNTAVVTEEQPIYTPPLCGPHYTPYTEVEDTSRRPKPNIPPLKFSFPTTSNDDRGPFSPIVSGSRYSIQSAGTGDDMIPALPMSPAAFLSTSTPAHHTKDITIESPMCQTLMDSSIFMSNPECNMCRICHEDGSKEELISPCHCTGTMGMLHMSCLEKWLGSSNTTKCEICQFKFTVRRKPHSFRWYMTEPVLKHDRWIVFKDFMITLTLTLLMLLVNSMCLVFAHRLVMDDKHGPASVLIIIVLGGTFFFCLWLWFVVRRFLHQLHSWHKTYHTLQIKQTTVEKQQPSEAPSFRKSTVKLPKAFKRKKPDPSDIQPQTLRSSYFNFSMDSCQSYKEAMTNPVSPAGEPLLQDTSNSEITSLECDSSSVISLYYCKEEQSSVTYYQPLEPGSTITFCSETGKLFRETGV